MSAKWIMFGFGVLLFAVVTAFLVLWGMRKAYFQRETLTKLLLSKCSAKVMHYLKSNDTVSEAQIRSLINGVRASEFYSRNSAVVQSDAVFAAKLVEAMLHDGLIVEAGKGKYKKK